MVSYGPVGDVKENSGYSVSLIQLSNVRNGRFLVQEEGSPNFSSKPKDILLERMPRNPQSLNCVIQIGNNVVDFDRPRDEENCIMETESKDFQDRKLKQQIEGLWKTDFGDTLVNTRPSHSVEDKKASLLMQGSFTKINGHYQVALPWRFYPPCLPNNWELVVRRCELPKLRLLRDNELAAKYKATMSEYIEKRHAERVPDEEWAVKDKPLWYLLHHPVVLPLKPNKVRVVYNYAAKYKQTSLNKNL